MVNCNVRRFLEKKNVSNLVNKPKAFRVPPKVPIFDIVSEVKLGKTCMACNSVRPAKDDFQVIYEI